MAKKLSQKEIAKRLVRLRNLERLHRISKQMRSNKDELIAAQAEQIKRLEEIVAKQQEVIEAQSIRIAELEAMVFGKKKRPPTGTAVSKVTIVVSNQKPPRAKASYRRPIPPATAITATELVVVDHCKCGGTLKNITVHERYQEDIPLPELTPNYQSKLVTKYLVERGICTTCGKATSGKDLGGQTVTLGPNAKLLICHLVSVMGMSYTQVTNLLLSLYGLRVTDGEIANILQKQHQAWLPAYDQLKTDIRAAPVVHGDETPWPIQDLQGAGYAWNICDANSPKVCFAFEQSRGATYAKELFGQNSDHPFAGVRITDDYGAYRNASLPGVQQLCWAHLYRSIRDLRYNTNLPKEQLPYIMLWYEQFAAIYQDLRLYLDQPFEAELRQDQANQLWQRTKVLASQPVPDSGEPNKLTRLKAQLLRAGQDRLFVCLPKNTPCDNNRAERDLRQLVLKRKRSFGSKSEKGAKALATLLSLCTTTWRTNPQDYFKQLAML